MMFSFLIRIYKDVFISSYKRHIKVILISIVILSIALTNYFVKPYQYDVLVSPHEKAQYDYVIYLSGLSGYFTSDSLSIDKVLAVINSFFKSEGYNPDRYAVVIRLLLDGKEIDVINDPRSLGVTVYGFLVDGKNLEGSFEAQAPITSNNPFEYTFRVGDRVKLDNISYTVVGVHFYSSGDLLIPYSEALIPMASNISLLSDIEIYVSVDDEDILDLLIKMITYLYNEGYINVFGFFYGSFEEALNSLINSEYLYQNVIVPKERYILANQRYVEGLYGSIFSLYSFYSYGGLIIFIFYLFRSIDTFFFEYRDRLALIYVLGASDKDFTKVFTLLFITYILFILPPSLYFSYLIIHFNLRVNVSLEYLVGIYTPLIIFSIVAIYLTTFIYNYVKLRRGGFIDVLFERFIG